MAYSLPFSALNERLRPRISTNDRLYASLYRMEYGVCAGSLRTLPSYYRPTVLPSKVESTVSETVAEPEEPKADAEQEVCNNPEEEEPCTENPCLTEVNLKDGEEQEDEDSRISPSEEKDVPGELTSEGTDASPQPADGEALSSLQRSYTDETLPDLIRSGRPLGRRRTLGHVSETLQEVRREVALSRKRSIKLKAQVDKLQESQEGQGWSQHRERVTEEVLSVLRLLSPLTEPETNIPDPSHGEIRLDTALFQLQNVARKLAMSHSPQVKCSKGAENNAILQQALYDRDEAISKKKAMEAELLRSKTEMMLLNNQLLEAVQKRLELSLELEAWKEDVQVILHQQLQSQQQAEQKKASRVGLLRRHNKPPIQRPSPAAPANQIISSNSTASAAPTPSTPSLPPPTGTQRNWRDKLRRGRNSRQADQEPDAGRMDNSFEVISLD